MGKFRSKLKRHTKGKNWAHGHSSTANPENQKHRDRAKSRYFQSDISLGLNPKGTVKSNLSFKNVIHHDAKQILFENKNQEPTVNDVTYSLKSFNIDADCDMSQSQGVTSKTNQTFASNYSQCTNMSFAKLFNRFRGDSQQHKDMLAVLAAATELIIERGGKQTSTEFYLILFETLGASSDTNEIMSILTLLGLGIKTVPITILRKTFSENSQILLEIMEKFLDSENQNITRNIINIISAMLRAQEYTLWQLTSTTKVFQAILSFATHSKPKIRKSAQHAITSIVLGSCFIIENSESTSKIDYHPASNVITQYCVDAFSLDNIARNQNIVLHALGLLHPIMGGLKIDDIKKICENLLSMMTTSNILIRMNCFHTIHSLFSSPKVNNLNSILIGKLITALYDYQPERSDARQTLAWMSVLKQGHICLSSLDENLSVNSLIKFIEICCSQLWMSDRFEIKNNTTQILKIILEACVKPVCENHDKAKRNSVSIKKIINHFSKCLLSPFGHSTKDIVLIFGTLYTVIGKFFFEELSETIKILGDRYSNDTVLRVPIEHTLAAAIGAFGPENFLTAIPINNKNDFILDHSWLLPLLRESIQGSSLEYFANNIVPLATKCNQKWDMYKSEKQLANAHTYELLCCQLWGLFPGFCRTPIDPQNFKLLAKTLGTIIADHPDLRAPVLDGLNELIANGNQEIHTEIARYSKNFLPRLFNLYTTKPGGSYEGEIREKCLETIKLYLKITNETVLEELFEHGMGQLKESRPGTFMGDSLFDIVEILALFQSKARLKLFYEKYVTVILKQKKNRDVLAVDELRIRKQQKKCYNILTEILLSENKGCVEFIKSILESFEKLLVITHNTTIVGARVERIKCIHTLFYKNENIKLSRDIVNIALTEAIFVLQDFSKTDNTAQKLIEEIGDIYKREEKLNDFVDVIIAGFVGDELLISNTILALKITINRLSGNLTVNTIEFILEQISALLVGKNRKNVEACLSFMITFVKVLPIPVIGNYLNKVVRSLSAMTNDTKKFCRLQYGYILKRLCKRFGAVEITKLVPGNDELTHKRLRRIRKLISREKRKAQSQNSDDEDENDEVLEKKTQTIEDILADTDSDSSVDIDSEVEKQVKIEKPKTKRRKINETYIQETPESIVDLADINSVGKVTTSKPQNYDNKLDKKPKNNTNRGFKTADDGRLIIEDLKSDGTDSEDDDVKDSEAIVKGVDMQMDSDDDDEILVGPTPRKKSLDSRSVGSRKTNTTASPYIAGGRGIHRNTAESVKSGASSVLKRKVPGSSTNSGNQYKGKKASGDVKKLGQLDPYAYIPLNRQTMNKRKRQKNNTEFKNIVKGARKGAAAGSKSKVRKAMMMKK